MQFSKFHPEGGLGISLGGSSGAEGNNYIFSSSSIKVSKFSALPIVFHKIFDKFNTNFITTSVSNMQFQMIFIVSKPTSPSIIHVICLFKYFIGNDDLVVF